jgi:hypothetical protein
LRLTFHDCQSNRLYLPSVHLNGGTHFKMSVANSVVDKKNGRDVFHFGNFCKLSQFLLIIPIVTLDCRFSKSIGYLCGCNNGVFTYWGADTLAKQIAVQWIQRSAAILSLCESFAILIRIFTIKRSTQSCMHFQIMFALSCADMLSSISWGLGSLPTNYDFNSLFGIDLEVFGDKVDALQFFGCYGNNSNCKVQGFVLQLGFMSILYNMALSYYYKLCVVDSYRDSQFNKYYKALLLGSPAVVGLIVALASIPFITFTLVGCTIGSFKDKGGWAKMILLFYLPYGPAFLFIPLNTIYVY